MAPTGVTLHVTRMKLHVDGATPESKRRLYADIETATRDLAAANLDAIAYGCTAGSMVMPLDRLTGFMARVAGVPCVATAPALVQACRALGVARVALATPYHDGLNEHEREFLAANGIEVVAMSAGVRGPHARSPHRGRKRIRAARSGRPPRCGISSLHRCDVEAVRARAGARKTRACPATRDSAACGYGVADRRSSFAAS